MIRDERHLRVQPGTLAAWLDQRGPGSWWSVDGDPLLMERVSFPCSADELAAAIRRINKPLLLLIAEGDGQIGDTDATGDDLSSLSVVPDHEERAFQLCWEDADPEVDWVLSEDVEFAKAMSDAA